MTEQKPLNSPIHPTTTTSTHTRATVDGSTNQPSCLPPEFTSTSATAPLTTDAQDMGRPEGHDQLRPVMPVVARTLDLDAIEAHVRAHGALSACGDQWAGDCLSLISEVRGLRDLAAGQEKTIATLSVAVGKVAQLHVDDGDGWCKACQTIEYPCLTAVAIGAGQ